jgi:hypothetical protein
MATNPSCEADLNTDLKCVASRQSGGPSDLQASASQFPLQGNHWNCGNTAGRDRVKPAGHRTGQKLRRNLHRPMTREQGRALEIIGHAADYLADCYLQEGAEEEIIDFSGPSAEAIQILISSRREILRSLPLTEPLMLRLWNMLLRRKPKFESASMIPFSSSR